MIEAAPSFSPPGGDAATQRRSGLSAPQASSPQPDVPASPAGDWPKGPSDLESCGARGAGGAGDDGSTASGVDSEAPRSLLEGSEKSSSSSSSRRTSSPGTPPLGARECAEGADLLEPDSAARPSSGGDAASSTPDDGGFWEVIGGGDKGGIIVRTQKDLSSSQERQRLSTGALVRQLVLQDGRLRFVLLEGTGPKTGWVSVHVSGKDLAVRTARRPAARAEQKRAAAAAAAEAPAARPAPRAAVQKAEPPKPAKPQGGAASAQKPAAAVAVAPPTGDVVATMQYLVHDGRNPFFYMYQRDDGGEQTHGQFEYSEVKIFDGRPEAGALSLDLHGVMLAPHATSLSTHDFYERPERVWGQYYKEMRELVQRVTGASRVIVFDHNIRNPREAKWRRGVIGYVPYAHNDYTLESAPKRVRDVAKPRRDSASGAACSVLSTVCADEPTVWEDEIDQLLQRRYVIINVWRNISDAAIAADPLAVADGRTVRDDSYIPTDLVYKDRVGQTYSVTHDPAHRWLYFSGMRKDEAILMKCFDSEERPDAVRWSAHCGFVDPRTPAGAPQRESIDARCIAFFDEGDVERTADAAAALFPGAFPVAPAPSAGLPDRAE